MESVGATVMTLSIATALGALLPESKVKALRGGMHGMLDANPAAVADFIRAFDGGTG
jgi:hypothetical protein